MNHHFFSRATSRRVASLSAATAAVVGGSVTAAFAADEPTADELMQQISKLQAQVEQMQANEAGAAATGAKESEADALTRVLDDAERRSSRPVFAQDDPDPFTAGHNGKFLLQSGEADPLFTLNPNFQFQFRYVENLNSENGDAFEESTDGFEVRRMKFGFKGNAFSPDLTYDFRLAADRNGGDVAIDNAYIDYTPEEGLFGRDGLGLRAGQYKDLTFREETTSSSKQIAVDRSLVNELIGGGETDFVQGIGLLWKGEKMDASLAFTDGVNSDNTGFNNGNLFGVAGRVDAVVMGDSGKPLGDFTALGTEENTAGVGAGFHYTGDGDERAIHFGIDGQYETDTGLGVAAGLYGRWIEAGPIDGTDIGAMAQVSQLIGDDGWEVFGRYDFVVFDEEIALGTDSEDFFHELTAGVNKYWEGHNVKMTIDVVFLPTGSPDSVTGIGVVASEGEFDSQVAIRGQFQLLL